MTAVGSWLRFTDIGTESLWADELYSVHWANKTVGQIFDNASSDVHPPSYYLLLHCWVSVVGSSETAVRALSAVLSILTIPLIAVLGKNLYAIEGLPNNHRTERTADQHTDQHTDRRAWQTGLVAAWILTFSHFHIYYAQEARNYALTALCVVWAMIGFVRFFANAAAPLAEPNTSNRDIYRRSAALYIVSNIVMMHTHFFALFVIVAQNVFIASLAVTDRSRFRVIVRHWIFMQCALLLLFVPWLRILLHQILSVGKKGFWIEQPNAFTLAETFAEYAGGIWLLGILAVLIVIGFWTAERSNEHHQTQAQSHAEHWAWTIRPNGSHTSWLLVLWLGVPIVIPFVQSLLSEKSPTYYIKYTIAALPAFVLLAARGFASLPSVSLFNRARSARLMLFKCAIVAAIALLSLAAVREEWSSFDKERWRETAQILDVQAKAADAIIVHQYYYEWALRYYCRAEHPVLQPVPSQFLAFRPNVLNALLQPLTERHERIWLVLAQKDGRYGEIIDYLRSHGYTIRSERTIASFYRKFFVKDTFAHAERDQTVISLVKTYWTPHIQLYLFERKPLYTNTTHH
jgi:uncharacterized membrane protein